MFIELTLNYAPFLRELQQFVARVQDAGRVNSLTQTLLKYTAPGMPDLVSGRRALGFESGGSGQSAAGGL